MSDVGISSIVGYLPRLRLSKKAVAQANSWIAPNLVGKGKGTRSMANWDEDSVTMSVEAITVSYTHLTLPTIVGV